MAREWSPISWGSRTGTMMVEQAKEELQILEAEHPSRFQYLKLELKSFICLLQSQNTLLPTNMVSFPNSTSLPASSTATTQASSTSKKRKKGPNEMRRADEVQGDKIKARKQKNQRVDCNESLNRRWARVEVVVERARACLWKIQQFKTSFY